MTRPAAAIRPETFHQGVKFPADRSGTLDTSVPIAIARRLASELPDATLHVGESSDHDIGHDHSDEITSVLAAHAT